jgi:hypothetical protein
MTTEHTVVRSGKSKRKPFNSNVADYLLIIATLPSVMRLQRAGSSRSSDNNQTDRPQPAVTAILRLRKAAREGLATARPVVFAASTGRFWISQERLG